MLCLPAAAMGETYVCKTDRWSVLTPNTDLTLETSGDWVIDVDSGIRSLTDGLDYGGDCKKTDIAISCSQENQSVGYLFYMRISDGVFSLSSHILGAALSSHFGKCFEI